MEVARVRDGALAVGGVVYLLRLQPHLLEFVSQHAGRPPRAQRHRQEISLVHMPHHVGSIQDPFGYLFLSHLAIIQGR